MTVNRSVTFRRLYSCLHADCRKSCSIRSLIGNLHRHDRRRWNPPGKPGGLPPLYFFFRSFSVRIYIPVRLIITYNQHVRSDRAFDSPRAAGTPTQDGILCGIAAVCISIGGEHPLLLAQASIRLFFPHRKFSCLRASRMIPSRTVAISCLDTTSAFYPLLPGLDLATVDPEF